MYGVGEFTIPNVYAYMSREDDVYYYFSCAHIRYYFIK